MTQRADIRKLEKEGARIKKQQERLTAKSLQLADAQKAHTTAMEGIIVAQLHEAGLMRRSLTELLEGIKSLGRATDVPVAEGQEAPRHGNSESVKAPEAGGSVQGSDVDRRLSVVTVKISSNVSDKNRSVLETARLNWNGKLGLWKGSADETTIAILCEHFGDRVNVKPQPSPGTDEGGLEAGASPKPAEPSSDSAKVSPEPPVPAPDGVDSTTSAVPVAAPNIAEAGEDTAGKHVETTLPPTNPLRPSRIGLPRRPQNNG